MYLTDILKVPGTSMWEWGLRLLCSEASTRGQQSASSLGKSRDLSDVA